MATVTFDGVTKRYGDGTVAVDSLSLDVDDGEFCVLVGPSGSGKSSALRMLAGLEEVSDGAVRIGPRVVNDLAPRDRDIAMVFQSYALYPHMDVAANMGFALKMAGVEREQIAARVQRAAGLLGIETLLHKRPKHLSGGQRQRVALGRAIVREPEAFLMDEPLSNLDAKLRVEMRAHLQTLHRTLGVTTIYVTHDQTEAMTMGDRVAVMRDGRLEQCASPRELYERPVNRFVAGFMGSPAMNFLPARVVDDGHAAQLGDGTVLALPARPALVALTGAEVTLGVRPEALALGDGPGVVMDVALVESLGCDTLVHGDVAGERITARLAAGVPTRPGDRLPLAVDTARVHIFGSDGGRVVE